MGGECAVKGDRVRRVVLVERGGDVQGGEAPGRPLLQYTLERDLAGGGWGE